MMNWLTQFLKDMRFLYRKSRRTLKVILKPVPLNELRNKTGMATPTSDPRNPKTVDAKLTGQASHYMHQNLYNAHNKDGFYKGDSGMRSKF